MDQYLDQAVNEYNAGLHIPVTPLPAVPKRKISEAKAETVQAVTSAQESADVFGNIARALERASRKSCSPSASRHSTKATSRATFSPRA